MRNFSNILIYLGRLFILSEAVDYYSCPDGNSIFADQCALIIPSNTTVFLSKSSENEVITLTRITDVNNFVSVGRSYDGSDWETVAGFYDFVKYNCDIVDNFCQVTVPEATLPNQIFRLSRFRRSLSKRNNIARFLEQVTFGTKPDELEDLMKVSEMSANVQETYRNWLTEQIYQVPPTLHREFFRKHLLPRYANNRQPAREGEMSYPCQSGARWRRCSFTHRDLRKEVIITKTNAGRYSLSVDGHLRTIVDDISFKDGTSFNYTGPRGFEICALLRVVTYSNFGIMYRNKCRRLRSGLPPIDIRGMIPPPENIFKTLDPSLFTTKMDDSNTAVELMLTSDLFSSDPSLCARTSLESFYNVPTFAQLTNGQVLIFDPVLQLKTNTQFSPLSDGGGLVTVMTNQISQCANAPRTFLNDDKCQFSSSITTCTTKDTLTNLSIELNGENLKKIYEKTGRLLYATKGLRLGEKEDIDHLKLPCDDGTKSRWIQMPDNNCNQNVQSKTAGKYYHLDCLRLHRHSL